MKVYDLKQCVCGFLAASGSREQLSQVARATPKQLRALLRWMDDGAIALYFWDKVQRLSIIPCLPEALAFELARRETDNRARSSQMLSELRAVDQAMASTGEPYAILKGFSLSPDFCPRPELRHQIDIDLLIQPESVNAFSTAIRRRGYSLERCGAGEFKFTAGTHSVASRDDYAYALPARELELHTGFWEPLHKIDLNILSSTALQSAEMHRTAGVMFPVLSLEWRLLLQLLHAYRHFANLWLRIGWLYELACFIEKHGADTKLSAAFLDLVERFSVANQCGFILGLVAMTFKVRLPRPLQELAGRAPHRARNWLQWFGMQWALAGFPGSKLPLMVLADFAPARDSAAYHQVRRMLPTQLGSILTIAPGGSGRRTEVLKARLLHMARRSRFHVFATVQYLMETARWHWRLASPERETVL